MADETNEQNPMDKARADILETIAMADSARQQLVLIVQDRELFGGHSPAAAEALDKAYEAHATICAQLKSARELLASTE